MSFGDNELGLVNFSLLDFWIFGGMGVGWG